MVFYYSSQGRLRWLCLRNYLPQGIVILPFQCVGASWLLKNGDRNLGLPGATMSLPPVVSALHHLWDSLWSKLSPIAQDPNSSPLPRVRGEPAYCSDSWSEPRPGYGMTLPEPGPELTVPPDKRKPPLSTNICSVGPPSGRVGASGCLAPKVPIMSSGSSCIPLSMWLQPDAVVMGIQQLPIITISRILVFL